jgi:predicted dehydrogenase
MKRYIQIGTGGFGQYWCKYLKDRIADVAYPVAAADINPKALENARTYLGLPEEKCYADAAKAVAENEADFAAIIVPPQLHEQMILLCLEKGLDIVCEKPLADTMEACARIYRAVKKAGRKLAVTMSHRLEVEKQTVEALVASGQYGRVNYAYSRLNTLRRDGLEDVALRNPELMITGGLIHNLDTLRGVLGSNAARVYADCWRFAPQSTSCGTCCAVIVDFENGAKGILEESFANATGMDGWSREHLRVECENATIVAEDQKVTVMSDRGYPYPVKAQIAPLAWNHFDHSLIIHDFVRWLDGGEAPVTDLEDNLHCCAMTFACIESCRTGLPVDVAAYLRRYREI